MWYKSYVVFSFFLLPVFLCAQKTVIKDSIVVTGNEKEATEGYNWVPPFDSSIYYKDTVIQWMTIEQALAAQKKNPKKIYVNIYANWCKWCKMSDQLVFRNREIAHYTNQHFYPVKFNCEHKEPLYFKDRKYTFINEEHLYVHEFSLFLLNRMQSYPGTVIINEDGNVVTVKTGYMTPGYTEDFLNFYGSDSYKTMSFSDFQDDFFGKVWD